MELEKRNKSFTEDWELLKIQDLIDSNVILGHLDGNHGALYPKSNEFKSLGVPYIAANDFKNGRVDFNKCKFLSKERSALFQKGISKNGDVLFAHNATVGPVALLKTKLEYVILSTTVTYFRCNENNLSNSYLLYYFQSEHFIKQYSSVMSQSTRNQVPISAQRKFNILVPPLPEQKAIAQVLSDTDNLIQAIEQKITKKRAIKQGAMQQLLTPKEDWEIKKLGTIAHFYNGKAHEQFIDANGEFTVINSKFISRNGTVFKNSTENLCPLKKGDITMVMSDIPNGKALAKCFVVPIDNKYTLNQRICAIRTEDVDTKFLYFILNRNKYYLAFDSGTGQTNLKKNDVLECPIPLPKTKEEQTEIATILIDMNKEIAQLEQKLSKYIMLKQGLMQNLLMGKIRLV
ncbi:restriction endonuclease subunit S [Bizionia myxarmorum]|uniref:Restriction endonuclease subunit S n=1 Tax=Bizionia myxarmorum TaxID=291186 RepID=A0A5D0RDU3_9FLAO|nr:restriction endonuclease subunit S [Bizionia myxarmorum]TYB79169.1 restriction endonuclease subunit S [Bizionia myxarmorum]